MNLARINALFRQLFFHVLNPLVDGFGVPFSVECGVLSQTEEGELVSWPNNLLLLLALVVGKGLDLLWYVDDVLADQFAVDKVLYS